MRKAMGVLLVVLGVSGIASGLSALRGSSGEGLGVYDAFIGLALLFLGAGLIRRSRAAGAQAHGGGDEQSEPGDLIAEFHAGAGFWRDLSQRWVSLQGEHPDRFPTLRHVAEAYMMAGYGLVGQSRDFEWDASPTQSDGRITLTFVPTMPSMLPPNPPENSGQAASANTAQSRDPSSAQTTQRMLGEIVARNAAEISATVSEDILSMRAWLDAPMTRANRRHVAKELQFARDRSEELAAIHAEIREAATSSGTDIFELDRLVARYGTLLALVRQMYD